MSRAVQPGRSNGAGVFPPETVFIFPMTEVANKNKLRRRGRNSFFGFPFASDYNILQSAEYLPKQDASLYDRGKRENNPILP